MGSVVLAVTGAEALYADMGHFGRPPIQRAWIAFVLPALALNYLGQGALLLTDPKAMENPFFLLAPEWLRLPLVVLATAATIIASQSMISGAYSIARQCVQLGFLPRLVVLHTSETEEGQIYLPQINAALLLGVLILVVSFRNSDSLAAAYGIAVTGTFVCTSCLAFLVFRRQFGWSAPLVGAGVRAAAAARPRLLRLQRAEDPGGRLGAGGARRGLVHPHAHLEAGARTALRPLPPGQPAAEVLPRAAAAIAAPSGCPASPSS